MDKAKATFFSTFVVVLTIFSIRVGKSALTFGARFMIFMIFEKFVNSNEIKIDIGTIEKISIQRFVEKVNLMTEKVFCETKQ